MPRRGPPFKLAEVEDQLLVLIAAGASARTIAEIFGVDPNTVKNQLRRMRARCPKTVRAALLSGCEAKNRNGVPGRRLVVDEEVQP